ncbi:MAG: helix-turn-helix transcriptional regulator [Proteobacteria bacterium]|nr:helix-turn-helix transcriptional regulator [Pseudomonadota bacterium]
MLHDALKIVRKFHQTSIEAAAKSIGVSVSYLSELENGKKRINQDILKGYSATFNMPISSIYLIAEHMERIDKKGVNGVSKKISKIIKWIAED